jgi:hypothetical protein
VWKYLIEVKKEEILEIPDLKPDQTVDDLAICEPAKWLVGFWLNRGVASPRRRPSQWMKDKIRPGSFWGKRVKETIADQLEAIRHWQVYESSYENCPYSGKATWFIDPPYQQAGKHYTFGSDSINYTELAHWCQSRHGQVIVCENEGAGWLPFKGLADVKTTRRKRLSKEVVWLNFFDEELPSSPQRQLQMPFASN